MDNKNILSTPYLLLFFLFHVSNDDIQFLFSYILFQSVNSVSTGYVTNNQKRKKKIYELLTVSVVNKTGSWSRGYDVAFTRRRSGVRISPSPLTA